MSSFMGVSQRVSNRIYWHSVHLKYPKQGLSTKTLKITKALCFLCVVLCCLVCSFNLEVGILPIELCLAPLCNTLLIPTSLHHHVVSDVAGRRWRVFVFPDDPVWRRRRCNYATLLLLSLLKPPR